MNLPLVWYILNKWQTHKCVGCISFLRIVAVLLLLFWTLFWKANCSSFLYGEAEPVKKMESVICCCKYHGTNVLRIALRINLLFLFTWFLVTLVLFTPVLHLCRLLSCVSLTVPGSIVILSRCKLSTLRQKIKIANSLFVGNPFVRHKSIIYL